MDDPQMVTVQATTTYLEGSEHKSERSEPYRVTRSHGLELQALGFAAIVSPEPAADPADAETAALVASEAPADPVAPRRRGRPPKAR